MENRVYTQVLQSVVLAAGGLGDTTWQIPFSGRESKLRSLAFDIQIQEVVSGSLLPLENNTTQFFALGVIQFPLGATFGDIVNNVSIPANLLHNATEINLYRPQQLQLNSFNIRNSLFFILAYTNNDALINYRYTASIICEIEDIPVNNPQVKVIPRFSHYGSNKK